MLTGGSTRLVAQSNAWFSMFSAKKFIGISVPRYLESVLEIKVVSVATAVSTIVNPLCRH